MNHTKSQELYAEAVELMPGGVDSPVRAFKSVGGSRSSSSRARAPI